MISFDGNFNSGSPLDLFNGNSPTGKWVVQFFVNTNGSVWLSEDGVTAGQTLWRSIASPGYAIWYRFVVENQPLYLMANVASSANVTVLPLIESDVNVNLGLC